MIDCTDRMVSALEDRVSLEIGLRMVLEAAETKELPPEGVLPCFSDQNTEELLVSVLERVTGKEY